MMDEDRTIDLIDDMLFNIDRIKKELRKEYVILNLRTCKHIWVNNNGMIYCLKCGINTMFDELFYSDEYIKRLPSNNIYTEYDFNFVQYVYNKILDNNPNIDDKTITKYVDIALNNIEKKNIKRLERKN